MNDLDHPGPADHADQEGWPSVGVVVATHNRPQLMRRALASILEQDYPGQITVRLVFDRSEPELDLAHVTDTRTVLVGVNERSPGLAGARNTGIEALDTELVAFCDDDDTWLPTKLRLQVQRLRDVPGSQFCTTAMRVDWTATGTQTDRLARRSQVTVADLTRSRMAMLHSSSFLFDREAMIDGFGMVDERLPGSMAEDWDLLLRAARRHPIEHIDTPLVLITWGASSYFNLAWRDKNLAHKWLIEHHPEIGADPVASALMQSKLAFGHAALGERRVAGRHLSRALRQNWREPRTYLAALVMAGFPAGVIQGELNKRGRGI